MATRAQASRAIAERLVSKRRSGLDFADILAVLQAAGPGDQQAILAAVRTSNARQVLRRIERLLRARFKTEAQAEADTIVADDALTLDELERVYGPF